MRRLRDRVAVVTGAGSGIGRAVCEVLARRGCDLALVDVDEAGAEETARRVQEAGRRATVHRADVSDRQRMQALPDEVLEAHGAVHVLVNNAGVSVSATFEEQSLEDFDWIVGINFWGVVHGCKFFLPVLQRQDEAQIVNLSSMLGLMGVPTQASYCATKFAVRGLSEVLQTELSGTPVRVLCVHPGAVRTNIVNASRSTDADARRRAADLFATRAMPPERAAELIVRSVERGRERLLVCTEAWATDWLKRLAPGLTQTAVGWLARRYGRPA